MPLKTDGNYRGPHASHVKGRRKLGKHRTIITAAIPLVDWLLTLETVTEVSFGKVANASGEKFSPRAECFVSGRRIKVLLVSASSAQVFRIVTTSAEAAQNVAQAIQTRWNVVVGPGLHAV